jgi:uncharacterized phage-associated protein
MEANKIAKYFLLKANAEEDTGFSNLKLQKLLYYAQGFHLAIFDKPLFNEEIYAWQHGPVCPDIYHLYKSNGSNVIKYLNEGIDFNSILNDDQIELLDEVYDTFGQYSAWKLRDMTHEEPTWINNEAEALLITNDEMRDYFKTRLN